jgi:5-formyltetrahydrofolate cyclo-ligase
MLKKDLRTQFLDLRRRASQATLSDASLRIANNALTLPIWDREVYHIFLHSPQKKEVDTQPLISLLQGKDKEIAVPKIATGNLLEHFLLTDNTLLKPNKWGIPEPVNGIPVSPSQIDVIFVPLLAFDRSGHRVGYGKGFYDRFFAECRENSLKIGVSLFEAVDEISDAGKYDIPLDYCLTPERVYAF